MTVTTKYFSEEQMRELCSEKIPRHIAIIPDGNRRWAEKQATSFDNGHRSGADGLTEIIRAAKEIGVKVVTVYTFSTENWKRDPVEINALLWLIQSYLTEECPEMISGGVRFDTIGDISLMPEDLQRTIAETKAATAHCDKITMVLAINYGSRDEIRRACCRIIDDYSSGKVHKSDITEHLIANYLDTAPWGDPDLYIRTSGEMRVSNYLLWQISYTEIYVTDVLWPDFKPCHLLDAVKSFQKRKRRIGT